MADQPLSAAAYRAYLDLLVSAGRLVQMVDIDACLRHAAQCEALGPILEPTAYARGGGQNLADQQRLLRAARDFRQVAETLAREGAPST